MAMLLHGRGWVVMTCSWGGNVRARKEAVQETSKYISEKVLLLLNLFYNCICLGERFIPDKLWGAGPKPRALCSHQPWIQSPLYMNVSQCFKSWMLMWMFRALPLSGGLAKLADVGCSGCVK